MFQDQNVFNFIPGCLHVRFDSVKAIIKVGGRYDSVARIDT